MRMRAAAVLCAAGLGVAALAPAAAQAPHDLPALTRIASKLSGLPARRPVEVVVLSGAAMDGRALTILDRSYPRRLQSYDQAIYRTLGLLGPSEQLRPVLVELSATGTPALYDPVARTLYLRAASTARAAALEALVHALQDQSFDLRRLSSLRRVDRDTAFAAAAAVDGDAAFATEVLGSRATALVRRPALRSPASHTGSRIRLFLDFERSFTSTTGLRFIASLNDLGGRSAVFDALRTFPTTTRQVFHIDAFLGRRPPLPIELPGSVAGFSLVREDTFGELDVRSLLAVFQVPRLDHVGEGWGGGFSALYRDAKGQTAVALVLDWLSELGAERWAEAVSTYVNEAFDADVPGFPPTTPCAVAACWSVAGHMIAFARSGSRTALVFGPSVASAAALAGPVLGS